MQIRDKLFKIGDSFTVNMYDNGFMLEFSGQDELGNWSSSKIICADITEVQALVAEAAAMERQ